MTEEQEKEQIFLELQAEIKAGLEAYERGECIPLEEVRERILNPDTKTLLDKLQDEAYEAYQEWVAGGKKTFTHEEMMKRYGLSLDITN